MPLNAAKTYRGIKVTCSYCRGEVSAVEEYYKCDCGSTVISRKEYQEFCKYWADTWRQEEIDEVVTKVADMLNNFSDTPTKLFVEGMARKHRTLQQSFTNLCTAWLRHLAALEPNQFDGRNEASVKLAKEIIEKVKAAVYSLPMV